MSDQVETYVSLPGGGSARIVDGSLLQLEIPSEHVTDTEFLRSLLNAAFAKHDEDTLASLGVGDVDDELTRFVREELAKVRAEIGQSSTLRKDASARLAGCGSSSGSSARGGVRVVVAGGRLLEIEVEAGLFVGPTRNLVDEINEALGDVWRADAPSVEAQMGQFEQLVSAEVLADDVRAVTAWVRKGLAR